jgi:hypothetical protein
MLAGMSAEDDIKELGAVAGWFAREIVGNEFGAHVPRDMEDADPWGMRKLAALPHFRELVAVVMVGDKKLSWPTMEEAYATLAELYGWETPA